jgi:ribosomal protein S18 acetylase RimI-like enzyme
MRGLSVQITKLKSTDWQVFKRLWLEALKNDPTAFYNIYEEKVLDPDWQWQEKFSEIYPNYFFAMEKGQPVGFTGYYINPRTKTRHVAEVVRVYVSPNYRHRGLGNKLLNAVISEIKRQSQITKINIHVVSSQIPAIQLYSSLGFKQVGRLHNEINTAGTYYDEILMEMMLK